MALVKPTNGQTGWGNVLNTALDYLDTNTLKPSTRNPVVSTNTDITLTLADAGTMIVVTKDENNYNQDFRVPVNSVVAFPIGTVITFVTIDATIMMREDFDEASETQPKVYGEGHGTGSNYMGFTGTGVTRLIKIATNDWILAGNNIWWD
jgi:hypothetical protein